MEQELDDFLKHKFFDRSGGGIGVKSGSHDGGGGTGDPEGGPTHQEGRSQYGKYKK